MSDSTSEASTAPATSIAGNQPLGFDSLESILGTSEASSETPAPKVEAAKEEIVEAVVKPKIEVAPKEETPSDKVEPTKVEATTETAAKPDAPKVEEGSKSFKLKTVSGREVEIPVDAKIIKKIDGVEQEVSISKALDEYSGKFVTEKRFTEIDQMKKAFEADIQSAEEQFSTVLTKAYNKDVMGALLELSDMAQQDPAAIFDNLRDTLVGDLDKFMSMSQQERDLHFANKKIEYLTRSKESSETQTKAKQAAKELEQKASEMREALGVSDEWLEKAKGEYESRSDYYQKTYLNGGKPDQTHFIQLADAMQRWDLAQKALGMVDPDLAADDDLVQAAYQKLVGKKNLTVEAASEIVGKPFKKKEAAAVVTSLTKKVEQIQKVSDEDTETPEPKATKKAEGLKARKARETFDWDDEL